MVMQAATRYVLAVAQRTLSDEPGLSLALWPLSTSPTTPDTALPWAVVAPTPVWWCELALTQQRATASVLFACLTGEAFDAMPPAAPPLPVLPSVIAHVVWEHGPGSFTALRATATWLSVWCVAQPTLRIWPLTQGQTWLGCALTQGALSTTQASQGVAVAMGQAKGAWVWQAMGGPWPSLTPLATLPNLEALTALQQRNPGVHWLCTPPPWPQQPVCYAAGLYQAAQALAASPWPLVPTAQPIPAYASQPQLTPTVAYRQQG
jgi:hypothetical protein